MSIINVEVVNKQEMELHVQNVLMCRYDPDCGAFGFMTTTEGVDYFSPRDSNGDKAMVEYARMVHIPTGEFCQKKVYVNSKGRHVKHKGYGSIYLDDFTEVGYFVPNQLVRN